MKYCTKCGTQLSDDTAFCPNCGQSVGTFTPAPAGSASAAYQPAPVVVRKLKTNRGMIKYFLLSLITFGIYGLVVLSSVSTDINTIASRYDGKRTMHYCLLFFIVSWLTLGIGVLVWTTESVRASGANLTAAASTITSAQAPIGAGTFSARSLW